MRTFSGLLGLLGCTLTACATTLPDAAPYAAASLQLRDAIAEGGRTTVQELRRLQASSLAPDDAARLAESIGSLDSSWKTRIAALDAVVAYSESLQAIVDAGNTGDERVQEVASSLEGLAKAAGVVPVAGAVAEPIVEVSAFVYAKIARMRAAKELRTSLREAVPAVERLGTVIGDDLEDLSETNAVALASQASSLTTSHQKGLAFRNRLVVERDALYAAESLDAAQNEKLVALTALIVQTDDWYGPLQEQLAAIRVRRAASEQLFAAAQRGLASWVVGHSELVEAIEAERARGPSVQSVLSSAAEIKSLIERIRAS